MSLHVNRGNHTLCSSEGTGKHNDQPGESNGQGLDADPLRPLVLVSTPTPAPNPAHAHHTVAPVIMTPRMISAAATVSSRSRGSVSNPKSSRLDFASLGRAPLRLTLGARRVTSRDLQVAEAAQELLSADVPEPDGLASDVSLLRGFNATIPSSEKNRTRRRQLRNVHLPTVGLKKLGLQARGMLDDEADDRHSAVSEDDLVVVDQTRRKGKRRPRDSLNSSKVLGKDELTRQADEIAADKENLHVRRVRPRPARLLGPSCDTVTEFDPERDIRGRKQDQRIKFNSREFRTGSFENSRG